MKLISLILLLSSLTAIASITKEGDKILPFELNNYPIMQFMQDYADIREKTLMVEERMKKNLAPINLIVNHQMPLTDFDNLFYTILASQGFTAVDDGAFLRIINSRDVRYAPTTVYSSTDFPKTDNYILVYHLLKNPLAHPIIRNMRPFMSRYGRIIDFNDAHSIVIGDRGKNIDHLLKLINALDNKKAVEKLKDGMGRSYDRQKSKKHSKEDLELEILELQKKKLEHDLGIESQSYPTGKRRTK